MTPQAATALGLTPDLSPDAGRPVGPFLVYPQLTLGGIYNDNVYPAALRRQSAFGFSAAPSVRAIDDTDLHKISLNLDAEAQYYPDAQSPSSLRAPLSIAAGGVETWTPTPDISVSLAAAFTRQNSLLQPYVAGAGFVASPSVVNLSNDSAFLDRFLADVSVNREFAGGFSLSAGGRFEDIVYENAPTAGVDGGQSYTASLRAGYRLTPQISGFLEGDANWQRRANASFDSNIQTAAAGLSSDLLSLFRGEIHAGYQRQASAEGRFSPTQAPTYGASLAYYPTTYWTFTLGLDHAFGFAAAAPTTAAGSPAPSPVVWQSRLSADYNLAASWRASASAAFAKTDAAGVQVSAWTAGARLDAQLWRNFDLTLSDQYSRFDGAGGVVRGYEQNITSLGVTYKY